MAKILVAVLAFSMCILLTEGATCKIGTRGKVTTFSQATVYAKLPCKYQAIRFMCRDYDITVVPGQILDSKGRYFVKSMWVSIAQEGTPYYWRGRISTKLVDLYFNDTSREPYNIKEKNQKKNIFSIRTIADDASNSVTLGISGLALTNFKIVYNGYNEEIEELRHNAGVQIVCSYPSFSEDSQFPKSLCGNETDPEVLDHAYGALTVISDILGDTGVTQTNPQCERASHMLQTCQGDTTEIIDLCSILLKRRPTMQCLSKYQNDPMDAFIWCLGYKCHGNMNKCGLLKEAMDNCPGQRKFKEPCE